MSRHDHVLDVEVQMRDDDGSYRLQTFARNENGLRIPTPLATVTDAQSIPQGLRQLAYEMEMDGAKAFLGRRGV